jgi:DNA-binding NarL/FixJ family response regulator
MNGEKDSITIYIVAASPVARAGLEVVLQADEKLIVAGGAAEISAAPLNFSVGQTVDVLLANIERQKEFDDLSEFLSDNGVDEDSSSLFVVALLSTDFQNSRRVVELLQSGARGILPNDAAAEEIVAGVNAAANDLSVVPSPILETLLSTFATGDYLVEAETASPTELFESLTGREREVLELLVEGESNKAIALRLNISEHTVKFHVASIFGKLGAGTRTEAVTIALRRGLILL